MALYLKSPTDIQALISGSTFAAVDAGVKTNLAGHFQEMPPSVWQGAFDVLVGTLDSGQANFVRALFTDVPTATSTSTATAAPAASGFSASITSVGDGAATSLERISTANLSIPALRTVYDVANDRVEDWLLEYSTAATGVDDDGKPNVQRPDDFDLTSNTKVWFLKR